MLLKLRENLKFFHRFYRNSLFAVLSVLIIMLSNMPAATASALSDTTPPTLVGFSFTPATVDTSNGTASITFTAHITDDLSGVNNVDVSAVSPSQTVGRGQ